MILSSYVVRALLLFYTQGERKAFKTTPAENIYASLSEVRTHTLLQAKIRYQYSIYTGEY